MVFVQLESVTGTDCVGTAAIDKCVTTACVVAGDTACAVTGASGTRTTTPARRSGNSSRSSDA
jgi:hypothetical protein